jgi:hypothetical protein
VSRRLTKADVVRLLGEGRSLTGGSAPWTLRFIDQADAQFGGQWAWHTLSGAEALEIILPPHAGEPCKGDTLALVASGGATVRQAAVNLAAVHADYARLNASCWSRISESAQASFTPVILTTAPLESEDYVTVAPVPGRLYHLDGFHRLVGWAWAGKLDARGSIQAVVAGYFPGGRQVSSPQRAGL